MLGTTAMIWLKSGNVFAGRVAQVIARVVSYERWTQ